MRLKNEDSFFAFRELPEMLHLVGVSSICKVALYSVHLYQPAPYLRLRHSKYKLQEKFSELKLVLVG